MATSGLPSACVVLARYHLAQRRLTGKRPITDAIPGRGWYDDTNGEIGDICAWKTKTVAGYTVQLEWSNKQGACI